MEDAETLWSLGTNHRIVQWRNVLFTHWFAPITSEALAKCESASFDLASRHPGGLVVFNVVEYGIELPSTTVRRKASAVLAATEAHVLCTATVICGEGFWASAGRAMVATITLFSKARHPHKVFATPEEGAQWSADHVKPDNTSVEYFARSLRRLATLKSPSSS